MIHNIAKHPTQCGNEKGEPSVRIVAPTALNTPQMYAALCRWWDERKELWDDQVNGLDRGDPARG